MTKVCEICGKEFAVTNRNRGKKICSLACRTQKHRMATIRSDIKTALKELGLEAHGNRIASHYTHAKEKHPYFCDAMAPIDLDKEDKEGLADYRESVKRHLSDMRSDIEVLIKKGELDWNDLVLCELWEVDEAIANGDTANAVEELYDAIAVCLRTIDVLEGRQKLGKPEGAK